MTIELQSWVWYGPAVLRACLSGVTPPQIKSWLPGIVPPNALGFSLFVCDMRIRVMMVIKRHNPRQSVQE